MWTLDAAVRLGALGCGTRVLAAAVAQCTDRAEEAEVMLRMIPVIDGEPALRTAWLNKPILSVRR